MYIIVCDKNHGETGCFKILAEGLVPTDGSKYSCIIPLHCLFSSHLHFSDLIVLATEEDVEAAGGGETIATVSSIEVTTPIPSTSYESKIQL